MGNSNNSKLKQLNDNNGENIPKITVLIEAHGADLINKPLIIDPNVRILSTAGETLCPAYDKHHIFLRDNRNFIEKYKLQNSNSSNVNTYEMLQFIKDNYKDNSKIFTPIFDHSYEFTDKNVINGIFVLDIQNKPLNCELNINDNLCYLKEPPKKRSFFNEFVSNMAKGNSENSIYEEINAIPSQTYEIEYKFYPETNLKSIIKFFKDKGFVVINIIDNSCRGSDEEYTQSKSQEESLKERENKMTKLINTKIGGKYKTNKRKTRKQKIKGQKILKLK